MKIARQTFHGPDRLTVVAGEVFADDDEAVRRWPDKFADPEEIALSRRTRSHSAVESATARPGELSDARAVNRPAKKAAAKAKADDATDEE